MSTETELIKERLDLAEIVGEYVQLKRAGQHYKGLCPFHHEKSPSFIVSPDKGIWHCFGCSEGGDLLTFIQKVEGIDFPAALKMLADRAGVELKPSGFPSNEAGKSRRQRLYEILGAAARFYHEILMRQPAGKKAKEYLLGRGVKEETMENLTVGYALQNWDSLTQALIRRGYDAEDIIATGLSGRSQRGKLYDRFRGRIMFPVQDVQGRVVAFGGRIVPWHETGSEGKYINSPETEIYEKRRVVYNLNRAKKHLSHREACLVVEGYMDVAMLVQSGVEKVVASSGTAFTSGHIEQLKRYTDTLHFAFDADAAGVHAAQAATREALAAGLRVASVLFPRGEDPADVAKRSPEEARKYVEQPTPLTDLLLTRLQEAGTTAEREGAFKDILPFVKVVGNVVQQGEMIQAISSVLHVPESVIAQKVARAEIEKPRGGVAEAAVLPDEPVRLSVDWYLLGLIVAEPAVRQEVWERLTAEIELADEANGLYKQLQHLAGKGGAFWAMTSDEMLEALPAEYLALAEGVRRVAEEQLSRSGTGPKQEGWALVLAIKRRGLEKKLKTLQQKVAGAQGQEKEEALQQFRQAAAELSAL